MVLSLALGFLRTHTTKTPLAHYERGTTYAIALLFISINVYCGKTAKLAEVIGGQIFLCYLFLGMLGELYVHRRLLADDKEAKRRRYRQAIEEIKLAVEALIGVCAFSCAVYEILDPIACPYFGYFEQHSYSLRWLALNVVFYLVVCDAWFYWWHYAFHALPALWPMHYQHHQLREPTSFGGPTVHVVELLLEYTIAHHLVQYVMPFHPDVHRALGAFAFIFGAVANHGGLSLDYNDHYAHHITWKGGRSKYCNYGMFFPWWDYVNGTRYDATSPPASAAQPREHVADAELKDLLGADNVVVDGAKLKEQ